MNNPAHLPIDDKIRIRIKNLGIAYEWLPVDPKYADTANFCEKYGFSPCQSGNTIIIASKRRPKAYCACLVLAIDRLDVNKKVKSLMQVSRLSFAGPEETAEITGMMIGGVTIFDLPDYMTIYVDKKVLDVPEIVLGGGNRSGKVIISSQDIKKVPNVQIIEGLTLETDH